MFAGIHILSAWHSVCLAIESQRYSPRGEMVSLKNAAISYSEDIDYSLHLHCYGQKKHQDHPLIWFEHGLGGQAMDFEHYMVRFAYFNIYLYREILVA
jgi:uncharacterized Zn-finger protein